MYMSTARLSKANLRYNIQQFKQWIGPETKLLCVLKANAYGHDAVMYATFIQEEGYADYLGVAQLEEAKELRDAHITLPILIFNPAPPKHIAYAIEENITLPIFTKEAAHAVVETAEMLQKIVKVHLKVDSGMNRIGVKSVTDAVEIARILNHSKWVDLEGIFTHFTDADEKPANAFTKEQFAFYMKCVQAIEQDGHTFAIRHCCNTSATLNFPEYHLDMVRVGIGLHGYLPDESMAAYAPFPLHPVMEVAAPITHIKTTPAHQFIGYGCTYQTPKDETIATVALGYADGVERRLSNHFNFTTHQQQFPAVGRVCMDQTMVKLQGDQENLNVGDFLIYYGDYTTFPTVNNVHTLAAQAGTFHYEFLCHLGQRVKHVWVEKH